MYTQFIKQWTQTNNKAFHRTQRDVGMVVANKVHRQVWISLQHPTLLCSHPTQVTANLACVMKSMHVCVLCLPLLSLHLSDFP